MRGGQVQEIRVRCSECGDIDERDVEILNVEEGMQGEDVLTFVCPNCGCLRKSERRGR
jgi:uncharacterized Zn finger protein